MTVREEGCLGVVEENAHLGVPLRLAQQKLVTGGVLLAGDDRCHMDQLVVAVLAGQREHHPLPLPLEVTTVNRNNLK